MKSLRELYKIGKGPSSSHTMGPQKAAKIFLEKHRDAAAYEVTLYGSLAATGKGHMTDVAIKEVLQTVAPVEIIWQPDVFMPYHPNGMKFVSMDAGKNVTDEWTVYSIGGGALSEGKAENDMFDSPDVYDMNSMTEIMSSRTWHQQGRTSARTAQPGTQGTNILRQGIWLQTVLADTWPCVRLRIGCK